jgi:hypothetical protein
LAEELETKRFVARPFRPPAELAGGEGVASLSAGRHRYRGGPSAKSVPRWEDAYERNDVVHGQNRLDIRMWLRAARRRVFDVQPV